MRILIQIAFLLIPYLSFSQVDTIVHLYSFGGVNNDVAEEIKATSDGGYIVIGSTSSNSSGNTDAYLLKVDSNCTYQWSKALGGTNNDWGYAVEETHDKGFIIALTSNSYGSGGYDAVLMKRDSLGKYQWKKTYGGNDWDFAYDVTQTYDSGYVFCGETYNNSQGYSDVWVVKTNVNGDTLWTQTIGGSLVDKGNAVIETSDSNIVVAGVRNTVTDSTQIYLLKFTRNGALLWDSIYGDSLYENANSVIEISTGDYVMGGATTTFSPNGDTDFYLLKTNSAGNMIWERYFGNSSLDADQEIFDVYEDASGNIINVGFTEEAGAGLKDAFLFYVNSGGWWAGISPTYGDVEDELFKSFCVGLNGEFCSAGYTNSFGNGLKDLLLVRTDTIYANQDTAVVIYPDTIPLFVKKVDEINTEVKVFPNPTSSYITFELDIIESNIIGDLELISLDGKTVFHEEFLGKFITIDMSKFRKQAYTYFYRSYDNQIESSGKIIVY